MLVKNTVDTAELIKFIENHRKHVADSAVHHACYPGVHKSFALLPSLIPGASYILDKLTSELVQPQKDCCDQSPK